MAIASKLSRCLFTLLMLTGFLLADIPLAAASESLRAFPGAEGFGAISVGGRKGRILRVTNLNPTGPGSLQAACAERGPRIVVFDVSGTISGNVVIGHGQITIAGQTAPRMGITIAGSLSSNYSARHSIDDVIIRHIRVRPPNARGSSGDAIQLSNCRRLILDHVCCSWGCDETIDIYDASDVTIQWCTIAESSTVGHPKGIPHNYGLISGPRGERVSIHHNLFAHHRRRCPAIANGPADFRNNVVYNFRDGLSHEGHPPNGIGINLVGNYYKGGPSDPKQFPFCFQDGHGYFVRDNFIEGVGLIDNPWAEASKHPGLQYYAGKGERLTKEVPVPQVITQSPEQAYERVLKQAGCQPHDTITQRFVQETKSGTGAWGLPVGPIDLSSPTTRAQTQDQDGDGIPDEWERLHGLDPTTSSDAEGLVKGTSPFAHRHSGYSYLEAYLNDCADRRTP